MKTTAVLVVVHWVVVLAVNTHEAAARITSNNTHLIQERKKPELPSVGTCDSGVVIEEQCLTFNEEFLNWQDAKAACFSRGGALASFADPDAVLKYTKAHYANVWWVGGSDVTKEGTWLWQTGEPLGEKFPWDSNYFHDEPNGNENENCLEIRVREHRYNDHLCHHEQRYICEGLKDTPMCSNPPPTPTRNPVS
ncbi:unnamed protein product, partial [Meganyctiphanes norvegica]